MDTDARARCQLPGTPVAIGPPAVGDGAFLAEEQLSDGESPASDDPVSNDSENDALDSLDFSEDVPGIDSPESSDSLELLEASIDDLFSTEADDLLALTLWRSAICPPERPRQNRNHEGQNQTRAHEQIVVGSTSKQQQQHG